MSNELSHVKIGKARSDLQSYKADRPYNSSDLTLVAKKIQSAEKDAAKKEIEKTVIERILKVTDKTFDEKIRKKIALNSDYTRSLTERIAAHICNKVVFEKERLGRA